MSNPQIAMVVAVVFLVFEALDQRPSPRVRPGWLGLALWAAVSIWR